DVDSSGHVYIADQLGSRIQRFTANGTFELAFGTNGSGPGQMSGPLAVSVGSGGIVYVADAGNKRIQRWRITEAVVKPTVSVTGKKKITTAKATLALKGTATNAAKVEVKVGKTAYKSAKGTTAWRFRAELAPGKNTILVRAVSSTGQTSAVTKVVVTRK
ncbi:MAG: hypothetical protein ACREKL_16535, partial [Chthoniobacterales bacterium]